MKMHCSMWLKEFISQDKDFKIRCGLDEFQVKNLNSKYKDDNNIYEAVSFVKDTDAVIKAIIKITDNEMFVSSEGETLHIRDIVNKCLGPNTHGNLKLTWVFNDENIAEIRFNGDKGNNIRFHRNYLDIETAVPTEYKYSIDTEKMQVCSKTIAIGFRTSHTATILYDNLSKHCQRLFGVVDNETLKLIVLEELLSHCVKNEFFDNEEFKLEIIRKDDISKYPVDDIIYTIEMIADYAIKYIL